MNSKLFSLNLKDLGKGLITSVLAGALTSVYSGVTTGHIDIKQVGTVSALSGIAYLSKNLLSGVNGDFLKK